jgi:hypothetical protein
MTGSIFPGMSMGQSFNFPIFTSAFGSVLFVILLICLIGNGTARERAEISVSLSDDVSLGVGPVVDVAESDVSGDGALMGVRGVRSARRRASCLVMSGVGVDGIRDSL